jgi:hypothetical protein
VGKRASQAFPTFESVRPEVGARLVHEGRKECRVGGIALQAGLRRDRFRGAEEARHSHRVAQRAGDAGADLEHALGAVRRADAPLDLDHLQDHRARPFRPAAQQRRDREIEQDDRRRLFVAAGSGQRQRFLVASFGLVEPADRAQALAAVRQRARKLGGVRALADDVDRQLAVSSAESISPSPTFAMASGCSADATRYLSLRSWAMAMLSCK